MNRIFLIALCSLALSACVRNNPKPIYLNISAWTLEANTDPSANDAGALTHNFSDVWVYIDNDLIGVFQVPCKIPVLKSGSNHIRLYPTIRNNGISAAKVQYPFVTTYETTIETTPGGTYDINPRTHYVTGCEFYLEDFENNPISIQQVTDDNSYATLAIEEDPNYTLSGRYGHVHLDQTHYQWVGNTPQVLLPGYGADLYMEIDYRNNIPVTTGTTIYNGTSATNNDNIELLAQNSDIHWKKIYIELKEVVSYSVNATGFEQYLKMTIANTTGDADVYLDNIKIIHI